MGRRETGGFMDRYSVCGEIATCIILTKESFSVTGHNRL